MESILFDVVSTCHRIPCKRGLKHISIIHFLLMQKQTVFLSTIEVLKILYIFFTTYTQNFTCLLIIVISAIDLNVMLI